MNSVSVDTATGVACCAWLKSNGHKGYTGKPVMVLREIVKRALPVVTENPLAVVVAEPLIAESVADSINNRDVSISRGYDNLIKIRDEFQTMARDVAKRMEALEDLIDDSLAVANARYYGPNPPRQPYCSKARRATYL